MKNLYKHSIMGIQLTRRALTELPHYSSKSEPPIRLTQTSSDKIKSAVTGNMIEKMLNLGSQNQTKEIFDDVNFNLSLEKLLKKSRPSFPDIDI